jgi:flavorubredoxin
VFLYCDRGFPRVFFQGDSNLSGAGESFKGLHINLITIGVAMLRVLIFYFSRTGNTEKMAKAVTEGARTVEGVEAEMKYQTTPEELAGFDAIIIGTPTYHHDMSLDMKNLLEETAIKNIKLEDKIGATFGSYGWSGEAPKLVLEILKNKFRMRSIEPPLIIKYEPDEKALALCRELGKKVSEQLRSFKS